jgi:polyisoprenoid-binding protein YceI
VNQITCQSEPDAATVGYGFVGERSRFTVQAFSTGMLSGFGHNPTFAIRGFEGTMRFSPGSLENASLQLAVRADSLELTDNISEKDRREIETRMRNEVLKSERYPSITFNSNAIQATKITEGWYRVRISGRLSLNGVIRPYEVDAQLRTFDDGIQLSGECSLLQSAYNIAPVSALGGLIKLKDELRFSFELFGQKEGQDRA